MPEHVPKQESHFMDGECTFSSVVCRCFHTWKYCFIVVFWKECSLYFYFFVLLPVLNSYISWWMHNYGLSQRLHKCNGISFLYVWFVLNVFKALSLLGYVLRTFSLKHQRFLKVINHLYFHRATLSNIVKVFMAFWYIKCVSWVLK